MRGTTFSRQEIVYYAVGLDEADCLAKSLKGKHPDSLQHMSQKGVLYVERVGSAPLHRGDLIKQLHQRAKDRAAQLTGIKDAP